MAVGLKSKIEARLIHFLAKTLPSCQSVVPLLSDSLERPMSIREKLLTKLHLFSCEACCRYFEQIRRMSDMLKPKKEEKAVNDSQAILSDVARDRIKSAIVAATRE